MAGRHRLTGRAPLALVAMLGLAACQDTPAGPGTPFEPIPLIPLTDLGTDGYQGIQGGLYPQGSNVMPPTHDLRGVELGNQVQPLTPGGLADPAGRYVLLAIGDGITAREFCASAATTACAPNSFMALAAADPDVNQTQLVMVNGGLEGFPASEWEAANRLAYDQIRDLRLAPLGVSEQQVQVVWLKLANDRALSTLPADGSDAHLLLARLGNIARALRLRYPNLRQVFVSSLVYGGYARNTLTPEPVPYETGFGVKWVIESQIAQMASPTSVPDFLAGNLNYHTSAPWLAWGPYLWADGETPRNDGLTWLPEDFESDGISPSATGRQKVADQLLLFFRHSVHTACWFTVGGSCA